MMERAQRGAEDLTDEDVRQLLVVGVRFAAHMPMVTAGLMWQPEMWPKRYAAHSRLRPNANHTPSSADVRSRGRTRRR